jgi:hypothetical protein
MSREVDLRRVLDGADGCRVEITHVTRSGFWVDCDECGETLAEYVTEPEATMAAIDHVCPGWGGL